MISGAASASDDSGGGLNAAKTLDQTVVTATKLPETIGDSAATVTLIDAEEIERRQVHDIKDLVRYEPGVSVSNDPARFGLSGFTIRGLGGNRVAIEVDGAPVADTFAIGSFSNSNRNAVDVDLIKRVEIVRGPGSSLYGSDALAGVVSFQTKDPEDFLTGGKTSYLSAKIQGADVDDSVNGGFTSAIGGERWGAMVATSSRRGNEADTGGNVDTSDATRTAPNPQDTRDDSLLAKWTFAPNADNRVRLTLDGYRGATRTDVLSARTRTPSGTSIITVDDLDGDDDSRRSRLAFDWTSVNPLPGVDEFTAAFYTEHSGTEQDTTEFRTTTTAAGVRTPVERWRRFDFDQSVKGLELSAHSNFETGAARHEFVYGVEGTFTQTSQTRDGFQRNLNTGVVTTVVGPDAFPVRDFPRSDTREWAVYAQDRITLLDDKLSLIPGVRWDRYDLDPRPDAVFRADNPGVTPTGLEANEVSPKLGASYRLTDVWSLHAQYAHGFRAPAYNDVNVGFTNLQFGYTAIPNPDLDAETSDGIELGVRARGALGYGALTVYQNRYKDFIESFVSLGVDPDTGLLVFQSQNLTRVRIEGVEFRGAMDLSYWSDALEGFTLDTAAAWSRGRDRGADAPLNSVEPPRVVLGITYAAAGGRWDASLVGTGVQRKHSIDDSAGEQFRSPGYGTLDVFGQFRINDHVRLSGGIFNLADKRHWDWSDVRGRLATDPTIDRYLEPGRHAGLTLTLEL